MRVSLQAYPNTTDVSVAWPATNESARDFFRLSGSWGGILEPLGYRRRGSYAECTLACSAPATVDSASTLAVFDLQTEVSSTGK